MASDVPAFETSAPHAGAHPLDDQVAFELGDGADDDDDGAAQRAAGVDLFAEADELDAEPVQLVEHFEEVPDRAGDPIGSPDQDHIEAAAAGIPHHLIETRPARLRAADPVCILLHDLIAALSGHLAQVVQLGLRDADRQSRPSDKERRVSPAPPLGRVLGDVALDELHQDIGHVLPLGGGGRLEGVVQLDGYVQVHSFHLLFFAFADLTHLLPPEMRLSGYEYEGQSLEKAPAPATLLFPGLLAEQDQRDHPQLRSIPRPSAIRRTFSQVSGT